MSTKDKRIYFKLGNKNIHVFYDHVNHLKVTKNVPGFCDKLTKQTQTAMRGGHITEIDGDAYNEMVSKLTPEEKKGILTHIPDKGELNGGEEKAANSIGEEERKASAIEKLKALNLSKPIFNKMAAKSAEEIEAFLEEQE